MDDTKVAPSYPTIEAEQTLTVLTLQRVGRLQGWCEKLLGVNLAGATLVQILVVVSNTPESPWRADVENVFV